MYFIDEIDLESTASRHVLDVIQQLSGAVDAGTRRRVNLNQINTSALGNLQAAATFAARGRGDASIAI